MALEDFIGKRQGQRTDLLKNTELVKKFSQVSINKGTKTRDFISKQLRFKNFTTHEQAKTVFHYVLSELIDQVNHQKISISKGARLANLPQKEQQKAKKDNY